MKVDIEEVASPVKHYTWKDGTIGTYDDISKPKHYNSHPSGIEAIEITQHMNFCLGNAIKYIWRASLKNGLEDLKKAKWYINREIERLEKESK